MWGAEDKPAWDELEKERVGSCKKKECVGSRKEKECVGLRNKEGAVAEDLGELPGSFFLKNEVNLAEALFLEASFLRWAPLSVWAVQLDSPPSPILTLSLQKSQYRVVLDAVNSDGCYK